MSTVLKTKMNKTFVRLLTVGIIGSNFIVPQAQAGEVDGFGTFLVIRPLNKDDPYSAGYLAGGINKDGQIDDGYLKRPAQAPWSGGREIQLLLSIHCTNT